MIALFFAFLNMYVALSIVFGVLLAIFWLLTIKTDKEHIPLIWFPQWAVQEHKTTLNKFGYILLSIVSNIGFTFATCIAILLVVIVLLPPFLLGILLFLFSKNKES